MEQNLREPDPHRVIGILRRWSHFTDQAFRIPGTRFRFGWDPLIGLIPGLGDLFMLSASFLILLQSFKLRVPRIIRVRMILNVLIDAVCGAVPVVGDIFDFAWKSNSMNLALLEKHAGTGVKPGASDWLFVVGTVAITVAIVALPIVLLFLLLKGMDEWIHVPSLWSL